MSSRDLSTALRLYALPMLVVILVAGSVFYSGVSEGVGAARDIDARYFYIAAKCWISGRSPYDPNVFTATYHQVFGSTPPTNLVGYPPTLMLIFLPIAAFNWPTAARCLTLINFLAAMILFWACYRLVRGSSTSALTPKHWIWVCLASTMGAIPGSVSTGQTSVFVSAALALVLVGCREQRTALTAIGSAVATLKPQLSGPLLLLVPFFEPRQRRAIIVAVGIVISACMYAALVDTNFIQNYAGSIRTYSQFGGNDPTKLIGLIPVAMHLGSSHVAAQGIGLLSLITALGAVTWRLFRSGLRLTDEAVGTMLTIFSGGIAMPIQGYDLCCYAPGISLMCTQPLPRQLWLIIPILIVWRPHVWERFVSVIPPNVIVGIAVSAIFFSLLAITVARVERAGTRIGGIGGR